jgi:hypothetical protein
VIYHAPESQEPLDQADIVVGCPIAAVTEFDLDGARPPQVTVSPCRVLVLSQACDLANRKVSHVTVAVVHDVQTLVEQNLIKPADVRGPIRSGRVFGWYFLPASAACDLPEMIVDLRQIHTVRLDLLTALCRRGQRRARIPSPYREHLAKHFADTFSRIGFPEPYQTES